LDVAGSALVHHLWFSRSSIEITEWSMERIEALLKAPLNAFPGFLTQAPDVIGSKDSLEVGCQPATPGTNIKLILDKVHGHAGIDELQEVGPIAQIPGTPIDLVNDESGGLAGPEFLDHLPKH
jgi:hypothetical protein